MNEEPSEDLQFDRDSQSSCAPQQEQGAGEGAGCDDSADQAAGCAEVRQRRIRMAGFVRGTYDW